MDRTPVVSGQLVSVGYDPETRILEVEFKNSVYRYFDVPTEIHAALMEADSKGRHFGNKIRGQFKFEKVHIQAGMHNEAGPQ